MPELASAPDAIQTLRREIERTASDPDVDPAERVLSLRRMRRDLSTLIGQADSFLGDNELQREAVAVEHQRGLTRARAAADARDDMVSAGVSTPEAMQEAGWPSHEEIDLAEEEGRLDAVLMRPWREVFTSPLDEARLSAVRRAAGDLSEGFLRRDVTKIMRLPNGHFAPKGQGEYLQAGMRVSVPHSSGTGFVKGKVERDLDNGFHSVNLGDGPDKGSAIKVMSAHVPGTPLTKDQLTNTRQAFRDNLTHHAPLTRKTRLAGIDKITGDVRQGTFVGSRLGDIDVREHGGTKVHHLHPQTIHHTGGEIRAMDDDEREHAHRDAQQRLNDQFDRSQDADRERAKQRKDELAKAHGEGEEPPLGKGSPATADEPGPGSQMPPLKPPAVQDATPGDSATAEKPKAAPADDGPDENGAWTDEDPNDLIKMKSGEAMQVGDASIGGSVYRTDEGFVSSHNGEQIKTKSHREAALFAVLGNAENTRDKHSHDTGKKDENGQPIRRYTQQRREWAKGRIDMALRERKDVVAADGSVSQELCADCPYLAPQAQKEVLFLAGGPASGKSSQARKFGPKIPAAVLVDPDEFKMATPEFQALKGIGELSGVAHHEAADMGKALREEALSRGLNLIVDGTGNSGKKQFSSKLLKAKDQGYRVHVFAVTIPSEEAMKRGDIRAAKTGRAVDHAGGRTMHRNVSARFLEDVMPVTPHLDSLQVWDNHQGVNEQGEFNPAKRVAFAGPDDQELKIDPGPEAEWKDFVGKAQQPEETDISDPSYV